MFEKKFVRKTMDKLEEEFNSKGLKCIMDVASIITEDIYENNTGKIKISYLLNYTEFVSSFMESFLKKRVFSLEEYGENLIVCFMIISSLIKNCEMTAKEKQCIFFNFVDELIEKDVLKESFSHIIPEDVASQIFMINEIYLKKIKTPDTISFEDLFDLRVVLLNLRINKNIINEIISEIKKDLNISSVLDKDDSKLSPSMKKLNNKVVEYSNKFIDGNTTPEADEVIIDNAFKDRAKFKVRNNLQLLSTVIFGNYVFTDFELLSNILTLFKSEFELNQSDFINIFFEIIERNIKIGILEEGHFVISARKVPEELLPCEEVFSIEININTINKLFEDPKVKKFCNLTKNAHTLLLDSYFNKKQSDGSFDNFSLNDLKNIKRALNMLEVNEYVVDVIIKYLKTKTTIPKMTIFGRVEKESLSSREYNEYMKILKTYIYIDDNYFKDEDIINSIEILKFLNEQEKSYCIDIMEKLGFSENVILGFLNKTEKENLNFDIIRNLYRGDKRVKKIIEVYTTEVKVWLDYYREYEEYRDNIKNIEESYIEYLEYYQTFGLVPELQECERELITLINEFYFVIDSTQKRSSHLLKKIKSKKNNIN